MAIEVELKFPLLPGAMTVEQVTDRLEAIGARPMPSRHQNDHYYAHPDRDFAQTDEALRISEDEHRIQLTYKGPLIDEVAKTRRELEIGIDSAEITAEILESLGFRPVRVVAKQRKPFELSWQGISVEAVIDQVEGLGDFVELETMSDTDSHQAARDHLLALATKLGLEQSERRSYLCLLLAGETGPT